MRSTSEDVAMSECTARRHLAALHVDARGPIPEGWLLACARLTARVERVSSSRALMDLGVCTGGEARAALFPLVLWLRDRGARVRAGVGPSLTLAQLAALQAWSAGVMAEGVMAEGVMAVAPDEASAFLRSLPVTRLAELHPKGMMTPAVVARLHGYGLRTLGQLARLDEVALRRQFGPAVGAFLAAVAAGDDPRPLVPTPPAERLTFRLRLPAATPPERLFPLVPRFAARVASCLRQHGRVARTLRLRVCRDDGGVRAATRTVCDAFGDPAHLARELRRLLAMLLSERPEGEDGSQEGGDGAIEDVRLILSDLTPERPPQAAFWGPRARRRGAVEKVEMVAETLALRQGRPMLLSPRCALPDAVFPEERYALVPGGGSGIGSGGGGTDARLRRPLRAEPPGDPWCGMAPRLHWW